ETVSQKTRGLLLLDHSQRARALLVLDLKRFEIVRSSRITIAPRLPVMIDDEVARHLQHPVLKASLVGAIALQVLVHADEDLLAEVLSLVPPAGVSVGEIENSPGVRSYDRLPGRVVSGQTALDQFRLAREHP